MRECTTIMSSSLPTTRLTPVPFADWDEATRTTLLRHLRRPELYLSGAPDAPPMPVVMELFAHHVPLSETFLKFTDVFISDDSTLDPRVRELLILRVAWRAHSGYEWDQHRRIGGDAGLSDAQLNAVPAGAQGAGWTDTERALLSAVDELIDDFAVSDDTWSTLASSFEPAQIVEMLFVVNGYLCLAGVLNSLGLRGNDPQGAIPESAEGT
jgi:4-carboxymuconolactone decarboxylase